LLIKYIKSFLWRVAKCLSYIEDARCLKVNPILVMSVGRNKIPPGFQPMTLRKCL